MKTEIVFDCFGLWGWPDPSKLAPYFLAPKGQEWFFKTRTDGASLTVSGLYGTDDLAKIDQVIVWLFMTGHPDLGIYLGYRRWDGRIRAQESFCSKGDISRLGEFVRTLQSDLRSVGLFIPFRAAWPAVKEFMETNGELPKSIEWISTEDLPPETFPDP